MLSMLNKIIQYKMNQHLLKYGLIMKIIYKIIINIFIIANLLFAQNVAEVPKTNLSSFYTGILSKLENLRTSPDSALKLLTDALPKITSKYERFNLIFWEIPVLYCELGKYEDGFDVLKNGQKEGLFYPFILGQNKFPPYIDNFEKLNDFQILLDENKKLRSEAQETAKFEYVVQLPKNYSKEKKYPLLIVLYGGFGNYTQQILDWHSPKLESDYITAYMQGDQCMGSFLRSYSRDNADQFVIAYNQIVNKYSVDTTSVLLGAQSAGAHHSFMLMLNEMIPIKGMILAFPAAPQLDSTKIKKAAERGVRIVMLAGEYDSRVIKTKEISVAMDKAGLQNRLIISSEKGHEFPDNFPKQIDLSLNYILKND